MPNLDLELIKRFLLNMLNEKSYASQEILREPTPPHDQGDVAAMVAEKENAAHLIEMDRVKRIHVEAALGRIQDGSYGTCVACDEAIPEARLSLNAVPWTLFCLGCQEKLDRSDLPGYEYLAPPSLVSKRVLPSRVASFIF